MFTLGTALISFRIWRVRRHISETRQGFDPLNGVITLIVESGKFPPRVDVLSLMLNELFHSRRLHRCPYNPNNHSGSRKLHFLRTI